MLFCVYFSNLKDIYLDFLIREGEEEEGEEENTN
jgi:hypothetical protein